MTVVRRAPARPAGTRPRPRRAGVALAALAVLSMLIAPAGPEAALRAQAPTPVTPPRDPAPPPAPTRTRPARPPDRGFSSSVLPHCAFFASFEASDEIVVAGEPVTFTVRADIECPQLLERRAAVLVIGSRADPDLSDVRAGLSLLVDTLAARVRTRMAIVDLANDGERSTWAASPAEFRRMAARTRALEALPAADNAAWFAALDSARSLLNEARPAEQRLLIVLDTFGPAVPREAVIGRVRSLVGDTRDAAGQVWLFDVGDTRWLDLIGRNAGPDGGNGTVITLVPRAVDDLTLEILVRMLLASASAPIESVLVVVDPASPLDEGVTVTSPPANLSTSGELVWLVPGGGHRQSVRLSATIRTVQPMPALRSAASIQVHRFSPAVDANNGVLDTVQVCVDPRPPGEAACGRAPTDAPAISPAPTATRRPTRIPLIVRDRAWLPIGMRNR